jgi:ABC-2 type transport system permease protein
VSAPATPLRAAATQTAMELRLTGRRAENLLAIVVIPTVVLVFFASTTLIASPDGDPVDFLLPGALALAIIATGLVNLGISTAYERQYGVLKRLGGSPLGRTGLLASKLVAVGAIVALQVVLLIAVAAVALGWAPGAGWSPPLLLAALTLGTVTFASLGLLLAGTLRAEATLALANGLFIAALLVGGIVVPISHLPAPLATIAEFLPAAALSEVLRLALGAGVAGGAGEVVAATTAWLVLGLWAVGATFVTARSFRWD